MITGLPDRALGSLLAIAALTPALTGQEAKWPPTGPRWETDPQRAFARAQAENKVVMAYDATAG
ncbi:MAG: hypothetical protein KDC98_02845 [Planctomycetes bacterium]|nr:hypothetical protein [Planctomycetota bacterium]